MDNVEKTVRKNYAYKGKILSLRVDDALLANGKPCKREIVEHHGGACVLYVEDGKVLLVKQYRYAYGEEVYEIPAGKMDEGEDGKTAALRELEEETGIRAKRAELLFEIYPTPGYTTERIYIYQAFDGEQAEQRLDEGEFLSVHKIELSKVKEMLNSGEIKDAKTIVALQRYFLEQEN